jgi:transposase
MDSPRHELSDAQWDLIQEFLPANGRRGKQWKDHRVVIDGILWALSDGGRWRNLPERFGKWKTVYERFRRWPQEGPWDEILSELQVREAVPGEIDWELFAIDGSVVRAHQSAAGASKKSPPPGDRPTTPWAAARAGSGPSCTW